VPPKTYLKLCVEASAGLLVKAVAGLFAAGLFVEAVVGLFVEAVVGLFVEAVVGLFVEAVAGLFVEKVVALFAEGLFAEAVAARSSKIRMRTIVLIKPKARCNKWRKLMMPCTYFHLEKPQNPPLNLYILSSK
jgi:hypothetical protein